jgi:PAS domain S-box-containing protein
MPAPRDDDEQLLATDLHVEATYRLTEALVEAEHRMRRRVELLSEVVFETDAEGRLVFVNGAWARVMTQPVDGCLSRHLVAFVAPADVPQVLHRLRTLDADVPAHERPLVRMLRLDGTVLWMEMSLAPIPGGGAVGVLHDVTRQKLAQDELAKVSLVASYTDNMVIITDANGRTEWVNNAFMARTGYDLDDLRGRKPGELLQGRNTDPNTRRQIAEALHEGRSIRTEITNYTKAGDEYWVQIQITPIRNAAGVIEQYVSVQSDATDRRRAELEIRALNVDLERRVDERAAQLSSFKRALDQHGLVVISDDVGVISYANDRMCEVSGYSREELVGHTHAVMNSGYHSAEFFADLWRTITAGQVWHGEIRNRTKCGTLLWLDTTIVPFVDANGVAEQFISIQTDITERKTAEERITMLNRELAAGGERLVEANRELESFAYSVSHDLRAPLRHIHGYLDMLKRATAGQLPERADRYIRTASDAAVQMGHLIDDLLAFSRMGQAEMRFASVDLSALIEEVRIGLMPQTEGRVIDWTIDAIPPVRGDASMLRQVLVNLLSNAIKYSGKQPVAEIRVRCLETEPDLVTISVQDNGAGFDMAFAHKLFGVFQRLHHADEFEGTGIGLAIVRRIVSRHGGRIWAESAPGAGATFTFTLPVDR